MGTITQVCWNTSLFNKQTGISSQQEGILPTFSNIIRSALNDISQNSVRGHDAIFHTNLGPQILRWLV